MIELTEQQRHNLDTPDQIGDICRGPQGDNPPANLAECLDLANQLYREYHTRCFWHCPRELNITEELIPFVVKGLRAHGGRRGFILASKLLPVGPTPSTKGALECL